MLSKFARTAIRCTTAQLSTAQLSTGQLSTTGVFSALLLTALLLTGLATEDAAAQSFVAFESGQVRPLAMSPDGTRLFAVNTPDNRLEIFDIDAGTLTHSNSVSVGLEPVAVAARSNSEVWVVNHLSDSISIIDVSADPPQVIRTLLVGDEPHDIVFANGAAGQRAYVTTARRGQNSPVAAELTTPGIGRALVWAFDPANLGTSLTGTPLGIIELFGDTPRALAVSPDGETIYAAVFHSGNRTTTVAEGAVCDLAGGPGTCDVFGFTMPGPLPPPNTNFDGTPQPEVGLIVKFDPGSGQWLDELDRSWNNYVRFSLPDYDVFTISNTTLTQTGSTSGVGTINFNMTVNPVSGKLYVSNTEAINEVRFEGPGTYVTDNGFKPVGEPASVIGHLHEARISIIDDLGDVTPRHLNKHIDYATVPSPAGTKDKSLATPLGMAVTSDGQTLYLAAFGSQKIGIFNTTTLENDSFVPSSASHITISGGGPTGVLLDEANDRLYVATRFDNSISVIDTLTNTEVAHLPTYNPEPANIVDGRPVLYDAFNTSSNGEASCASCHVFGDIDSLAWDLGNPDEVQTINDINVAHPVVELGFKDFHPMKGPMTTQTLRGLKTHGAMHWRGDRSVGHFGNDPTDEELSFNNFIVAFEGLLGNDGLIPDEEMFKFTAFMLDVVPPPNPIRPLDNKLSATTAAGEGFFRDPGSSFEALKCDQCHLPTPSAGRFGTNRTRSSDRESQHFKVPHLRGLYQKVGMFGMADVPFFNSGEDNTFQGDQVRGFGFLHDGSTDTIFRFLGATQFALDTTKREQIEQFMFEFPTNYAPIVGQQTTLSAINAATVGPRIDLLIARAKACFSLKDMPGASECDLVVKGNIGGEARGWLGKLQGACDSEQPLLFQGDRATDPVLTDEQLRALATGDEYLTYTCVPPGSGMRIALDRDEDGFFDRDEIDAGSDPADAVSVPTGTPATTLVSSRTIQIKDNTRNREPKRKMKIQSRDENIGVPATGSGNDPTCNADPVGTVKVSLTVSSTASGQVHRTNLPCQNWTLVGTPTSPRGYRYKDSRLVHGTVKSALWLNGSLKLVVQGKGAFFLNYDLVSGVSEDTVHAVLINNTNNLCMACSPYSGRDGADGKQYLGRSCAAPASCGTN